MPKPVCVACKCFYQAERNGYRFLEGMPIGGPHDDNIRGHRAPELWEPYKLWNGDLWKCPDCGHLIIVGCGQQPMAEHYMEGFTEAVEKYIHPDKLQVNDC